MGYVETQYDVFHPVLKKNSNNTGVCDAYTNAHILVTVTYTLLYTCINLFDLNVCQIMQKSIKNFTFSQ